MSESLATLTLKSHRGPYSVTFSEGGTASFLESAPSRRHYLLDQRVARLYARQLTSQLNGHTITFIEATEHNKDIRRVADYAEELLSQKARRGDTLIAIGGGIVQDITCFLASTLFRGMPWYFVPTTLLAQADSCIGSKSSINLGSYKNILGTYTPPEKVHIDTAYHQTLTPAEICSGIGEMLKVHALAGVESLRQIATDYQTLHSSKEQVLRYIRASLIIKQKYIEEDEFDRGIRNVLNYGHSFGHAIESATNFAIPHGVAVSMGIDFANYVSWQLGLSDSRYFQEFHGVFQRNYSAFSNVPIGTDEFLDALAKDKKNTATALTLILPGRDGQIDKHHVSSDERFRKICEGYLQKEFA